MRDEVCEEEATEDKEEEEKAAGCRAKNKNPHNDVGKNPTQ